MGLGGPGCRRGRSGSLRQPHRRLDPALQPAGPSNLLECRSKQAEPLSDVISTLTAEDVAP